MTPADWQALALSVQVGLLATALVLPPGILLGWLLARRDFPGKALLDALVHLPLVLTPVVVGYGLLQLLGRRSAVGSFLTEQGLPLAFAFPGAVLAAAVVALPLTVRSVRLGIELVDPGLEQAAALLGAGPWRRLWTITLPLAAPGILAGAVLAFARALGEFGATITFAGSIAGETRTLPLAIHGALQAPDGDAAALRLALASVAISVAALLASEVLARRLRRKAAP